MCTYRHILFLIVYFHRSYPAGVLRILVVVGSTPTEVERRDTNHLVIGQCEIKDADILYHPLFVHGLGNDHHATLKVRTDAPHPFVLTIAYRLIIAFISSRLLARS